MGKRGPDKQPRKKKSVKIKVAPTIDEWLYERLFRIALKVNGDTPPPEPGTVNKEWIGVKAIGEQLIIAGLHCVNVLNEIGEFFVYDLQVPGLPKFTGDPNRQLYRTVNRDLRGAQVCTKRTDMKFDESIWRLIHAVARSLDCSDSAACELMLRTSIDTSSAFKSAMQELGEIKQKRARHD